MAKLVSTTYGDALFELALEEGKLQEMRAEVEALRQVFVENDEIGTILSHPEMDKNSKITFMENIFKGECSDNMMGFLVLTVEKGRHADIIAILDYFIKKAKEEEGIGTASVTSAVELTEKGREVIEARLLELTNYKSFETTYIVDESLIGGLVIRIGDRVVDSSIKTKLQNMKKTLTKIQLS